jgi:hypothetical protein
MPNQIDVWFVASQDDENIFALPRPKWTADANATKNHYQAVTFSTEYEALDFCYEYEYGALKWVPRLVTFEYEVLH